MQFALIHQLWTFTTSSFYSYQISWIYNTFSSININLVFKLCLNNLLEKDDYSTGNSVRAFDIKSEWRKYMEPYMYDNCKLLVNYTYLVRNKVYNASYNYLLWIYNKDNLWISRDKLHRKMENIVKHRKNKVLFARLSRNFAVNFNRSSSLKMEACN